METQVLLYISTLTGELSLNGPLLLLMHLSFYQQQKDKLEGLGMYSQPVYITLYPYYRENKNQHVIYVLGDLQSLLFQI